MLQVSGVVSPIVVPIGGGLGALLMTWVLGSSGAAVGVAAAEEAAIVPLSARPSIIGVAMARVAARKRRTEVVLIVMFQKDNI